MSDVIHKMFHGEIVTTAIVGTIAIWLEQLLKNVPSPWDSFALARSGLYAPE